MPVSEWHPIDGCSGPTAQESTRSCNIARQLSDTTASSISLDELSFQSFLSRQCTEIDAMASEVADGNMVTEAIREAVSDGKFFVAIGDPRNPDVPLVAVSDQFQQITGYYRSEVLGKNCRFLDAGVWQDQNQLVRLRSSCETGSPFTGVLTNRRKSGEFFLNLLDMRGLTVAHNPCTGESLWFLVSIHADVSNVWPEDVKEEHLVEMHRVANGIRAKLADELSAMAVAGALAANTVRFTVAAEPQASRDSWCLLPVPSWRPELPLAELLTHIGSHRSMTNKVRSDESELTVAVAKLSASPAAVAFVTLGGIVALAGGLKLSQDLRTRVRAM